MNWVSHQRARRNRVWRDQASGQFRQISGLVPVAYDGERGPVAIDMTPQRVGRGWQITANAWHFRLNDNGWVGFGGRGGQHWLRFHLLRLGYFDDPAGTPHLANSFHPIGGAPTYDPTNLSQSPQAGPVGPDGEQPVLAATFAWHDLWPTLPAGEIYAQWQVDGARLKEAIVLDQAARNWLAANRPPSHFDLPVAGTYFGLVFQVDWAGVPKRLVNGIERGDGDDFTDDDGAIELRDASDALLGLLPIDAVVVPDAERGTANTARLRKRFWRDGDGNTYLAVGLPVAALSALPAGDLVFDPTVTPGIAANSEDVYYHENTSTSTEFTNGISGVHYWGRYSGDHEHGGYRFVVNVPQGATIDSAYLKPTVVDSGSANTMEIAAEDADDSSAWNYSSLKPWNDHQDITPTTARVNWDLSSLSSGPVSSPDIKTIIQEIVDRAGWQSGNHISLHVVHTGTTSGNVETGMDDYSGSNPAQLEITYTVSGANIDLEGSTTLTFSTTASLSVNGAGGGSGDPNTLPQSWRDSTDDVQVQFTADGRVQVGDQALMATDDALLEIHRDETETGKPKRGLHTLGTLTDSLNSVVAWVVQELHLKGTASISALHSALRVRLTNDNTGASGSMVGADLRAADIEIINNGGDSGNEVPEITGLHVGVTNQADGYAGTAYGIKVEITDDGSLNLAYALHADAGLVHVADALEVPVLGSDPSETPPTGFVLVYVKLDAGVPRWYSKDDSDTVRAM